MVTYLMLALGFIAHVLSKVIDAMRIEKIKPIDWFKVPINYMYVLVSAISCIALAFIVNFNAIPDFDLFGMIIVGSWAAAFASGWLNNSIIRAIINKFEKTPPPAQNNG